MKAKPILDPASGSRGFYFDKIDDRVVFGDIRSGVNERNDNNRVCVIEPDVVMDFTDLPFGDKQFKLVIFDPPHMTSLGETSWYAKKYGRLTGDWKTDLAAGFVECWRVLDDFGTMIFKWNEYEVPLSDIRPMFPDRPVIGHRSGKKSLTHWIVFFKSADAGDTTIF